MVDGRSVALGTWAWMGQHVHQKQPLSEQLLSAPTAQNASALDVAATQQMQVGWFTLQPCLVQVKLYCLLAQ